MCENKCSKPELKPKEGKCGEKQIKECHGEDKGHKEDKTHPCK